MTWPCTRCGTSMTHIGTSPAGAEAFVCPKKKCQHVMFVAVKST